jgi:cell wall-associated NlpC family hydrolase
MTGRHDPPRRRGHSLIASGVAVLGLSMLVVPLSDMTIADSSHTGAATPSPAPATSAGSLHTRGSSQVAGVRIARAAAEEAGDPYKYGAEGPLAYDCSGLTQHVFARFGIHLPHSSAAQYRAVDHVPKSNLRMGDLVFYYDDDGIYHVGIYAGSRQIWAAGSPGEVVRKHHIWTHRFVVGRP